MILEENRFGHITNGKCYLAPRGIELEAYKDMLRNAYGSLRGVKLIELHEGAELLALPDAWQVPYSSEYSAV